jgi:hypothetical protein
MCAPAHVLMRLYPIDKSLACLQSNRTTDFPVVKVHDELSSAQIGQHELCATLSANVDINYCLPIKLYYRICTLRHIRIEINHGNQNVFSVQ